MMPVPANTPDVIPVVGLVAKEALRYLRVRLLRNRH